MPPPPPPLAPDDCLFLDVDGTLIEFTDTPSQTVGDPQIKTLLAQVSRRLNGALALVSGREINTIDQLFAPLELPAAGLHGVERRDASGNLHGAASPDGRLDRVRAALQLLADSYPGTIIEDKGRNIAVHYRLAPQFGDLVRHSVAAITAPLAGDYQLQDGLMMVEIKPRGYGPSVHARDTVQRTTPRVRRRRSHRSRRICRRRGAGWRVDRRRRTRAGPLSVA
jgi:trehalose 6-phosphate phosphatase